MSEVVANLISAVTGAILGAFVILLKEGLKGRSEARKRREMIGERYIFLFQEAVEGLWYRLENLAERGGQGVMQDEYFKITTLYALGYPLAMERILVLDAVFPQLDLIYRELGQWLREHRLDAHFEGQNFYRYDRIALAEALIERKDDWSRPVTFSSFRLQYESSQVLQKALGPAVNALATWEKEDMRKLMALLSKMANLFNKVTKVPTAIS
jgi:hypothetical protein